LLRRWPAPAETTAAIGRPVSCVRDGRSGAKCPRKGLELPVQALHLGKGGVQRSVGDPEGRQLAVPLPGKAVVATEGLRQASVDLLEVLAHPGRLVEQGQLGEYREAIPVAPLGRQCLVRSEEHTSEL